MPTSIITRRSRAGWWVAALTGVLALFGSVVLFRPIVPPAGPAQPVVTPKVHVERLDAGMGNTLMREQITMRDPTPLFLPSEWNSNQQPLPAAVRRQPGQVFGTFEPIWFFNEDELPSKVDTAQSLPASPLDLLQEPSRDPFFGFGREDIPLPPLPARQGFVEVSALATGKTVFQRSMGADVRLPDAQQAWQPAEFLVNMTVAGMLGQPVQTLSSNSEEMDAFLHEFLVKTLHLGERLDPGLYRVLVGP